MIARIRLIAAAAPLLLAVFLFAENPPKAAPPNVLQAGAAVVNINPTTKSVIVNGMFTERTADQVVDPLTARALVLDDGAMRLAFCIVDTCMMPRELIDTAKAAAAKSTGIPADHILISATHTHSAPSAMGCLGSRLDPEYAAMLPGKIAQAISDAAKNLQPARAGCAALDDWDHTHNRRWIRRPDRILQDPFGQQNVRANMHPGYQSPDVTGPSGPVDPQICFLAVESAEGKPLALLANYSMHYYGSPLLSSDYFGKFAGHLGTLLGAKDGFVAMMSQGTSGDLGPGDYSRPQPPDIGYDAFAREIATRVAAAYRTTNWKTVLPLGIAESKLTLDYRLPDAARMKWAAEIKSTLGDRLPQSMAEIYALEAFALHDRRKTEIVLQALRVGDLGITTIPNEVFCLTGLKLKARSPFALTMNITLANGADGYIPPPEQHALGGYTTWPARTAGLEVMAEPRITAELERLLAIVAGQPCRTYSPAPTEYSKAILNAKPLAYWRLEEMDAPIVIDATGQHPARLEPGVAVFLPGMGEVPRAHPTSRAYHFAGGRIKLNLPLPETYSVSFWLWNGLPPDARAVTGYAFSRGPEGVASAPGEHLGIGGTALPETTGRLFVFNGNDRNQILSGKTVLAQKAWHHVTFVREGSHLRVHLDGRPVPEIEGDLPHTNPPGDAHVFFGGRSDQLFNWEGKLDEIALFSRALTPQEINSLYQTSGLTPATAPSASASPEFSQQSPADSLAMIHVPAGFEVKLAASEPQTMDPIAIDWDLAGRLWVVEMADYPLGLDNKGAPGGRVRVLEDINGDGTYEKSTLFAEGLNFPTGILTWKNGILVTAAPDVLFLTDTDGDLHADSTERLISGLQEGNQQLRANGLRWGLDNWIYCAAGGHHGDYGAATKLRSHRAQVDVPVGSRDFRFRPDSGELEAASGPSQFGRNRDDRGHWFGTQNSRALWEYVLPDHYLQRNPHIPSINPTQLVVTPLNAPVFPASPPEKRFHSFENAGHFTSACSGHIYRDDFLFPASADQLHAFTCEPFHNLVQHNVLAAAGVSFTAQRAPGEEKRDFFASADRWCRPVMTRTGPDGALWVVDMYRYIIEHPDWLPENGRAELLPHYRLGENMGRIYRVVPKGKPVREIRRLDTLSAPDLLAALDSPNEWQRDKAHMALIWKGDQGWENSNRMDAFSRMLESPNPLARLHTLCIMAGTGQLPELPVFNALHDPSPAVREQALRLAEQRHNPAVIGEAAKLAHDLDPKVRLQLAFSIGAWPPGTHPTYEAASAALVALAEKDHASPFMRAAILSSATPHLRALCAGLAKIGGAPLNDFTNDLLTLSLALGDDASIAAMLGPIVATSNATWSESQIDSLARFLDALHRRNLNLNAFSDKAKDLASALSAIPAIYKFAAHIAPDSSAAASLRASAVMLLMHDAASREGTFALLAKWLQPTEDGTLQLAAVAALSKSGESGAADLILRNFTTLSPATRAAATEALLGREAWTLALLSKAGQGMELSLDALQRSRLTNHASEKIRERAARVIRTTTSRQEALDQFRPALQLKGDATRGWTVFASHCIGCHKVDEAGLEIGPDLKSVVDHPAEKLLTNILDPSLDVQPGYFAYQAKLTDGTEIYGLVASETANSIAFKLTDGSTQSVARKDVSELKSTGLSLMPPGLETGLTTQEMADMIAWLKSPASGRPGPTK